MTFARRMRLLFRNTMLNHGLLSSMGSKRPSPVTPSSFLRLLSKWAAEKPRRNYQFAIIQRQGSQLLVGCCGLRTADSEASKAEFGIELAPEFWGRFGYAIEIMHALGDFGFGTSEVKRHLRRHRERQCSRCASRKFLRGGGNHAAYSSLDGCARLEPS